MSKFLHRACPACGSRDTRTEMRAGKAAETMHVSISVEPAASQSQSQSQS